MSDVALFVLLWSIAMFIFGFALGLSKAKRLA